MTDPERIEAVLRACEESRAAGRTPDLAASGFWKTIASVKRDPTLIDRYADRIAAIDRAAFEDWAWLSLPISVGAALLWIGTAAGLGVVAAAYYVDAPWNGLLLLAGSGALLVTTHGLGHLIVGRLVGIRFTHWFIGKVTQPQPGVKTDYASYLRTPPRARAWMHAAGALTTKLMPFLLLGAAWGAKVPAWAWWVLILVGVTMIASDVTLSVKKGDWKKFRREMRVAREIGSG